MIKKPRIGTGPNDKGGFRYDSSVESKELVKKLYHVMKRAHVFYLFQRSFYPLKGLSERLTTCVLNKRHSYLDRYRIGEVHYIPTNDTNKFVNMSSMPNFIKELALIMEMLCYRNNMGDYDNEQDYRDWLKERMSKDDIAGHYAKYYFENYKRRNIPTPLTVRFIFGFIFTVLFMMAFYFGLSTISMTFALAFTGCMFGIVSGVLIVYVLNMN